jgi:hypothetical protein
MAALYGLGDPDYHLKRLIHVETIEIRRSKNRPQLTFHLSTKRLLAFQRNVNRGVTWHIELFSYHNEEIRRLKI